MTVTSLFDLSRTLAGEYLSKFTYPWQAVKGIKDFVWGLCVRLDRQEFVETAPMVLVHKSAKISPSAYLCAPSIIGSGTEVRHCAFIRGGVLVGENCVVGNSTELKNAILFDGVQVPHFNYVGDSVLGYKAHLGAGAITSNVKSDKTSVKTVCGGEVLDTGLRKLGAMLGDGAEVGCNAVLNPGAVIGRNTIIYPLSCVRGEVAADSVFKGRGCVCRRRGFVLRGGELDYERAERAVIDDFRKGRLGRITLDTCGDMAELLNDR